MRLPLLTLFVTLPLWCQTAGTHGHTATMRSVTSHGLGYLGAGVVEVTPERARALRLAEAAGVEVKRVESNSAASKAGLKMDDVILELNKEKIETIAQFIRTISGSAPGTKISMTVWREGAKKTLTATLETRPDDLFTFLPAPLPQGFDPITMPAPVIGVDGETLTPQLAQYFGVEEGVLVRTVNPGGPAERAGIKAGDVIVKVNGTPVTSAREISGLLRLVRKPVIFTVVRDHKEITLNVVIALEFDPWHNPWGKSEPNGLYWAFFRAS